MIDSRRCGTTLLILESEVNKYRGSDEWKKGVVFNKSYVIQGKTYTLVETWERQLPFFTVGRIARLALGFFCFLATCGLALLSSTIQRCFTGRQVIRVVKHSSSEETITDSEQPKKLIVASVEAKVAAPIEVAPVKPKVSFDKSSWKATDLLFATPKMEKQKSFTHLLDSEVQQLLDCEPSLKTLKAAQGSMTAYDSILAIHAHGIPRRLEGLANKELQRSMQFILYTISQESNKEKRQLLLLELARGIEDCVAVTQGSLAQMHMKLASMGGFDKQLEHFISVYKDKIVDETLYELYPHMQKPSYAEENYHRQSMQFPHMKTGFLAVCGEKLGINCGRAIEDPNKNTTEPQKKKEAFINLFKEKLSIHEIIKAFIIDVNGRQGQIDINNLTKWYGVNLPKHADICFHDEELEYPTYSPSYATLSDPHSMYLTEKAAYLIFEKLGYIAL